MTAPQLTDLFSSAPRTLQDVHGDLNSLMTRLQKDFPEVFKTASALFPQRRAAMTSLQAAEDLLSEVQGLIPQQTPVNLPFPASVPDPVTPEPAVPSTAPTPTPAIASTPALSDEEQVTTEEREVEPDAPAEDDAEEEQAATEAPASIPAAPSAERQPTWPAQTLGEGLFSQLAHTLAPGETLQLVIVRSSDQLLVTVQPTAIAGENGTALDMQLGGTPAALDEQMVTRMLEYREGRALARETASYADRVKAAAEAARKAVSTKSNQTSSKPAASTPVKVGSLFLEVSPKDAALVLTDEKGQTHPVSANKDVALAPGSYTLSVDAEGYEHAEEKLTIKASSKTKKGVVLRKANTDSGLF